ncbi:MAG: putative DNA binding domain-containing protein [Gammaproteobacteria bacterium]|nr:putative DNA binding domain-containing protein [Gammaproteobacteria bacterium]
MNQSILQLLQQSEGKQLEFKHDLSSPKPIMKTLTAFANTAGGTLIIGITDSGEVTGVENPLDEEERLCSLIADSIAPRIVPTIEMVTVEGKTLLMIEVFLSGTRPHFIKSIGHENGTYVRLGSTNRQADNDLIGELQRGLSRVSFDSMPMPHLSQDDLDINAIAEDFSNKQINDKSLQSLRILTTAQGKLVPTQGGILLYAKDRRFHFDDAWIQCGRFIGNDKADIFDQIDIVDPLPKAVDSIMLFLKKHAMRGADFSEIRRKDIWSIPIEIMREVVVNALVHADYSHRGTPIRIAFFDNRIEVESPGILLPGLTIDDMKQGVSQIRNPVIARIFKELDLIEQWGSGIPGIFKKAQEDKLPEPVIKEIGMRVRFTVKLKPIAPLTKEQSRKGSSNTGASNTGAESVTQSDLQLESRLESRLESKLAARVIVVLQQGELGKSELAESLRHKSVSGELNKQVKELLAKELIERTIPDKPNSRLQKYRLTQKGKLVVSG